MKRSALLILSVFLGLLLHAQTDVKDQVVSAIGSGNAAELATYLAEKGKPLVVLAK